MMRFEPLDHVIKQFSERFGYDHFLVTLGKQGSVIYKKGLQERAPIMISTAVDTVGAGDALFSISSLFAKANADNHIMPFIANCAGGIKANYMGNKESVTEDKLLSFVEGLLNPDKCETGSGEARPAKPN
jgi:sugar/nucleoside kinase (ribokinase family)